jgi:hypothetical protein
MASNVACSSLPSHQQVEAQKKSCTVEAKDAQMATTCPHGDVLQGAGSHKCSATGRVACGELRAMATTEEGGSQHPLSWPHTERCTPLSIFTSHSITHSTLWARAHEWGQGCATWMTEIGENTYWTRGCCAAARATRRWGERRHLARAPHHLFSKVMVLAPMPTEKSSNKSLELLTSICGAPNPLLQHVGPSSGCTALSSCGVWRWHSCCDRPPR